MDLNSTRLSTNNDIPYGVSSVDNGNASAQFNHTYQTIRLGLNYRFNQTYEPLK